MAGNSLTDEFGRIQDVLREHPLGMSIKEISAAASMSRNSAAKYLEILMASGQLDLRMVGNAKLYTLSTRVPVGDLLNQARELIIVLDNDLRIVQASGSYCTFTGAPLGDILHARLSSLPVPLISPADEHEILALLNGGPSWKKEIHVLRGSTEFYFDSRFIPTVLENNVPGITLILEDITERTLARKGSLERDRLLQTLFQIPKEPQFFIDRNHKVVYWDRALEIMSGIKAEVVVGTSDHWRLFHASPHPTLADLLVDGNLGEIHLRWGEKCTHLPSEGKYLVTEFYPDARPGGRWFRITATLIRDTAGNLTGAMETLEDVSDKYRGQFIVQK
jgi:PAS domain-containing protein